MTDPGDLSPSAPAPPSQPDWAQQRKADQSGQHVPPPQRRAPQAPNPQATRGEHWQDKYSGEGRYLAAAASRRAAAETEARGEPGTTPDGTPPAPPASGEKFRFGDNLELTETEVRGLLERHSIEQSRRLTLPQKPEEYEAALPKDFKLPQGFEYTVDPNDPVLPHARDFALKAGLSKDQFQELVGLHVQSDIARQLRYREQANAEVLKLGAAGTERVTAAQTFLRSQLGDDLAAVVLGTMSSAKHVEAFEKLMSNFRTQGGGTFSTTGREPPVNTNGQIPGYETMTFEQKRAAQEALRRNAAR
jgi:hypothetical protein